MREIIVYTLSDPRDNHIKYVGITSRPKRRLYEHLNDDENNKKSAWVKKLKSLELEPIYEVIEKTDLLNYSLIEQYWISQFKSWGFELLNMTDGGEGTYGLVPWNKGLKGVFKHSEESKLKMSNQRKGKAPYIPSEETKRKLSEQRKGKKGHKWTEEQKIKFKNSSGKSIHCYDLEGNFIKEYKSAVEAEIDGFNSNAISKVCRGVRRSHKDHIFTFKK